MKNKNKIKYNLFFSLLSQVLTIFLGLVIPRIIMTEYGSEVNGFLSSVNQFIVYLSLLESGINQVALRSLYQPVHDGDITAINRILSAVNKSYNKIGIYYLIGLTVLAIVYPLTIKLTAIGFFSAFLVILFSGLGNVVLFFVQGKYRIYLQAEGKNYILTNIQTAITVVNNFLKILLLSIGANVAVVIMCTFCISLIQATYLSVYVKKNYMWMDCRAEPDDKALEQKGSMLIHQIAGLVFQNTDVLIITLFCGLEEVSVYSVYKLILVHINSLLGVVYNSFNYYLGQLFNTNRERYIDMIDLVEVFYSSLVFSVLAVTACLMLPFVKLYTKGVSDANYLQYSLALLFVSVELLTFMRIPMLNTIHYAGAFKSTLPQTIIETAINVIVSLIAVKMCGISGVLIGTIVALIYRTIEMIFYVNKKILSRSPWKTYRIYAFNWVFVIVVVITFELTQVNIETWIEFILIGLILTVTVFVSSLILARLAHQAEYKHAKRILQHCYFSKNTK